MRGKIFGIGFHKTGTRSLYLALREMGIRAAHWEETQKIVERLNCKQEYEDLVDPWEAMMDLPIPLLYKELDAKYQASKFILTVRDEASWLRSVQRWTSTPARQDGKFHPSERMLYQAEQFDLENVRKAIREHEHDVQQYFKDRPKDLLVFNIFKGDSWPELAEFLNKPIPSSKFPFNRPDRKITLAYKSWTKAKKIYHKFGSNPGRAFLSIAGVARQPLRNRRAKDGEI